MADNVYILTAGELAAIRIEAYRQGHVAGYAGGQSAAGAAGAARAAGAAGIITQGSFHVVSSVLPPPKRCTTCDDTGHEAHECIRVCYVCGGKDYGRDSGHQERPHAPMNCAMLCDDCERNGLYRNKLTCQHAES